MLQRQSEEVRACHEQAAGAKGNAEAASELSVKVDGLGMERRSLLLARSIAFTKRLGDFAATASDWLRKPKRINERSQVRGGHVAWRALVKCCKWLIQGNMSAAGTSLQFASATVDRRFQTKAELGRASGRPHRSRPRFVSRPGRPRVV